jgi:prepilin-type N-terminal cleavage/methylation domain-containing protein
MDSLRKSAHGFTLIEVAIVVAIMTILLTLGLGLMNAQLSSTAYTVTKKRQDAIKDALIAYLGANRRLPCPYVPVAGTAVSGLAPAQSGSPLTCPTFGIVPFATLGLSRETGEDGWGNFFSYRVYTELPNCSTTPTGWDWGNASCFGEGKDGVTPAKAAQQIRDGTVTTWTSVADNSIAVVISHGGNGLGAWVAQGTRNVAPTTCEETHNAVGATPVPAGCTPVSNTFYKGERDGNDDVVAYLTAADALQTLVKQGVIKPAMAKVNDDLQTLMDMAVGIKRSGLSMSPASSSASSSFMGGFLNIDVTLTVPTGTTAGCDTSVSPEIDAAKSSPRDPWGNAYIVQENSSSNKLPICFSSNGGNTSVNYCQSGGTCSPSTPLCKSIDRTTFNSYIVKAGGSC